MMIQIKNRVAGGGEEGAAGLLIACHQRIRHFVGMAERLAAAHATPRDIVEAAAALDRYFNVALPLHSADEDLSLLPRLKLYARASVVLTAESLAAQHEDIHLQISRMSPLWRALIGDAARIDELRETLGYGARRLAIMFEDHLGSEERIVFPAIARFPPAEERALRDEMRARREPARKP
jgi:hypothetical protein